MLKSLFIKNYVLIERMELDFAEGFHVFTGETGAGKSIIVGALALVLGNRADFSVIRNHQQRCEISALFAISDNKHVLDWLDKQEIEHTNEIECRRIINKDGRSKCWLNARPCTNATLKQLGTLLVQIHGQHEQIKLNDGKYQLQIIDESGDYQNLLFALADIVKKWHKASDELKQIELAGALNESESQLLHYQHEELCQLNLTETELNDLHLQQKQLSTAVSTLDKLENSLAILSSDHSNINAGIAAVITSLSEINSIDLKDILMMLDEVSINLNEIESELQNKQTNIEVDPSKLKAVEQRLENIYNTARKHKVAAEMLYQHHQDLATKLALNDSQKQNRDSLLATIADLQKHHDTLSLKLFKARQETAAIFQQQVTKYIRQLGLNNAQLMVNIKHNAEAAIHHNGQDSCDFEVVLNAGQQPQKMSKTASGGELSRIALAIEICKKSDKQATSFIFDEVDAGIGGAVAETVGKLMRKLSHKQQVFAVTHLPHVAGLAHHHYVVNKSTKKGRTESRVTLLTKQQRIEELARMSGGSVITATTLEQAKAFMLD